MTERKRHFIDTYVATFLAHRSATHYDEWRANEEHDRITRDNQIEDAVFLALEAWGCYAADKTLLEPPR